MKRGFAKGYTPEYNITTIANLRAQAIHRERRGYITNSRSRLRRALASRSLCLGYMCVNETRVYVYLLPARASICTFSQPARGEKAVAARSRRAGAVFRIGSGEIAEARSMILLAVFRRGAAAASELNNMYTLFCCLYSLDD